MNDTEIKESLKKTRLILEKMDAALVQINHCRMELIEERYFDFAKSGPAIMTIKNEIIDAYRKL